MEFVFAFITSIRYIVAVSFIGGGNRSIVVLNTLTMNPIIEVILKMEEYA